MARVTVEDCLENVDNRFELIMVSTKRARQLQQVAKTPTLNGKMTSALSLLYVKSLKVTLMQAFWTITMRSTSSL